MINRKQILKEIKIIKKDRVTAVTNLYKLQDKLIEIHSNSYDEEVKKELLPYMHVLDIYADMLELNEDTLEYIKEEEDGLAEEEDYYLNLINKTKLEIDYLQLKLRDYISELGANKQKKTNISIVKKLIKL